MKGWWCGCGSKGGGALQATSIFDSGDSGDAYAYPTPALANIGRQSIFWIENFIPSQPFIIVIFASQSYVNGIRFVFD